MKNQILTITACCLFLSLSHAQNNDFPFRKSDTIATQVIDSTWQKYIKDIDQQLLIAINRTRPEGQKFKSLNEIETFYLSDLTSDKRETEGYSRIKYRRGNNNPKMLNEFLSKEVSSFFSSSSDLSLQRYYANYNSEDKTINVGVNWDPSGRKELSRLNWIYTAGLKIKTNDEFGVLINDGEVQTENVGLTFKSTKIFRPFFDFNSRDQTKTKKSEYYRNYALKKKYTSKVEAYLKSGFKSVRDSLKTVHLETEIKDLFLFNSNAQKELDTVGYDKAIVDFAKKKQTSLYKEIAADEVKFIQKNGLYRLLETFWVSFDAFVPFGIETINTTTNTSSSIIQENNFYPFTADLSLSYLNKRPSTTALLLNGGFSLKNNNNILAENLSSIPFETIVLQEEPRLGENPSSITKTTNVFVTDFEQFLTPALDFEFTYFFKRNKFFQFGFGTRIEQNFGKYDAFNFKASIPFVIRDRNGKPTVNIEAQYRNINSQNQVGFATSILFGRLIN